MCRGDRASFLMDGFTKLRLVLQQHDSEFIFGFGMMPQVQISPISALEAPEIPSI